MSKKIYVPEKTEKHELAGRMYEACDTLIALENGEFKSIDEIISHLKKTTALMSQALKAEKWVSSSDHLCIDLFATIELDNK